MIEMGHYLVVKVREGDDFWSLTTFCVLLQGRQGFY